MLLRDKLLFSLLAWMDMLKFWNKEWLLKWMMIVPVYVFILACQQLDHWSGQASFFSLAAMGHWYPCFGLLVTSPWFSKPGWIPHLRALSPACNEFPRFTSGVTPADCIEVSMAAKPFRSTYLQMCPQALVEVWGSNPWPAMPHARRCRPLGHSGSAWTGKLR